MQTSFTAEQLEDPDTQESNRILRTCVHCGFCTATCPTFELLGGEAGLHLCLVLRPPAGGPD